MMLDLGSTEDEVVPCVGTWIEMFRVSLHIDLILMSSPAWGRGLKYEY